MSTTIAQQLPPVVLPADETASKQPNQSFTPRALSASKTRSLPSILSNAENVLSTLKSTKSTTYHAYSTFDLAFPSKVDRWRQKAGKSWMGIGTPVEEHTDGIVDEGEVDGQSNAGSESGLEIGGVSKRVTRQMRHDQAIQDFHRMTERIGGQIKKEIEKTISDFRKQLEMEILELNATFETVTSPFYLRSLSKDVLSRFWSAISDSSNHRLGQIDRLESQLEKLETKRAQKLQREVRLFDGTLREIGWLGGQNLKSLLEDHVAKLNISILTNRSNVTHWCAQLRIENVRQGERLESQYETNVTQVWKKLRVEYLSDTYRKSVKLAKFPERREALEAFRAEMQQMHKLLEEHLTSIHADTRTPSADVLENWNQKSQSLLSTIKPHFQSFLNTIKSHTPEHIAASLDTLTNSYRAGLIECDVAEGKIQEDIDSIMQQIIEMEGYSVGEDAVEGIPVTALLRYMDFEGTVVNDFGAYLLDVAELWSEHQSDLSKLNATVETRFQENEELYHRDLNGLQNLLSGTLRDSTKDEEAGTALEVLIEKINTIMLDMEKAHRNLYESGCSIMKSVPEATRKRIEIYREKLLNFFEMSLSPDDVRAQKAEPAEASMGTRLSSTTLATIQPLAASSCQNMQQRKGSLTEPLHLSDVKKPITPSDTLMSDVTGTVYYIWEVLNEAELLREKYIWWKDQKSQEGVAKAPSVAFQVEGKVSKEISGKGAKNKTKVPEILVSETQDKTQGCVTVPLVLESNRNEGKPFKITEFEEISSKLNFPSLPQQLLTSIRRESQKAYLEQLEIWESTTLETAFQLVQTRIDEMVNALNERLYRHSFMEKSIREQANQQKAVQVVERHKHIAREMVLLEQTAAQIKQAYTKAVQEVEEKTAEFVASSKKFGVALRKTRTLQGATKIRTDFAAQHQSYSLFVKDTISRSASAFDDKYFQMKIRRHNVNAGSRAEYNLDGFVGSFSDRLDGFRKKSEQAMNALNESVDLRAEDLRFLEAASRSWGKLQTTVMAEMSKYDSASKELNSAVQSFGNHFKGQIGALQTDDHEFETYVHILRLCDETRQTIAKRGIYLGCLKKADTVIAPIPISFSAWKEGTDSLAYAKTAIKGKPKSAQNEKPRRVGTSSKKMKSPSDLSISKLEVFSTIVEKLVIEAKDSAVIAGEEYYKKKGIRPISCVERVPVNLPAYVVTCSEKAEGLKNKYEGFRKKLVSEYRSQLARLWKACEELYIRMVNLMSLHSQNTCTEVLEHETNELAKELARFKIEKTQHWQQLSPSLSHPDNSAKLEKLNTAAKLMSSKIVTVTDEFRNRFTGRLEGISEHFIEGLLFTTITLVKILNSMVTTDVIEKPEPDEEFPQRIPIRELLIQPSTIPPRPSNAETAHKLSSPANPTGAPGTPSAARRLSSVGVALHTPEYKSLDFGLCPFSNLKHLDPRGSFSGMVGSEQTYRGIEGARNRAFVECMNRVERDLDWFKVAIGKVHAEEEVWMGAWKASVKQLASIQM